MKKSNADLALDYGFVESKPDRNAYTLTLEIPESDPFYDDKLDIAETNGLGETAYFDIVLDRPFPDAMLPFLRLLALGGTDAFLLESLFRNSIWGHLEMPVSRANEEFVCQVVRNACEVALSGYRTTLEEVDRQIFIHLLCIYHTFMLNIYSLQYMSSLPFAISMNYFKHLQVICVLRNVYYDPNLIESDTLPWISSSHLLMISLEIKFLVLPCYKF